MKWLLLPAAGVAISLAGILLSDKPPAELIVDYVGAGFCGGVLFTMIALVAAEWWSDTSSRVPDELSEWTE